MKLCEKEKFPYCFFILVAQWHEFPAQKFTNFHIFIISLPLNLTLFSKDPHLTSHIETNFETGCIGRFSEKTQRYTQCHSDS